jgi:hypothetical protein
MKAADQNTLASSFVVLVILFASLVMAPSGSGGHDSHIANKAPSITALGVQAAASSRTTAGRTRPTSPAE